jgi:hypothetical protein
MVVEGKCLVHSLYEFSVKNILINYILLYVNNTICITRMNMVSVKLIYPPSLALMLYVYDTKVRRLGENNRVT